MATENRQYGRRTPLMREIEAAFGDDLVDLLKRLYYTENLTLAQIVVRIYKHAGVSVAVPTLGGWMVRFGLDRAQMAQKAATAEAVA